ncbi:MAG: T9SS type A sorting domain-containing protein [candidate division Zixibacteria bacterium]|nr:T9SS type A sorting domain-containing protein [candidate division Zixibacteria bacterium]
MKLSNQLKAYLVFLITIFIFAPIISNAQDLRVNVMPGNTPGNVYPYTWPGNELVIWGNVHGGTAPYTYTWEFGDGTPPESGDVTNSKYIAVNHTYNSMGPKRAVLTVTDANSFSDQDTVEIEVAPLNFEVEVNAAIEKGLRYLYLQQQGDGRWDEGDYDETTTALAVLSFENQNHLPINDYDEDIYAEYVKAGLDYLTSRLDVQEIGTQTYGDPEEIVPGNEDDNGLGVYPHGGNTMYQIGMVMMAMVASGPLGSGAPDLVAPNGPDGIIGRTYRELVVDMVDYCAWGQNEAGGGYYRGGWRYEANYGDSDNSVSQWPAIGIEAAETNWLIGCPGFVKDELDLWAGASQVSGGYYDGAFNYQTSIHRDGIPATGAGLCELSFCDIPYTNDRYQRALSYLETAWGSQYNVGFYYSMYGVAKGCRIAVNEFNEPEPVNLIGSIEWYDEYANHLVDTQEQSGNWPPNGWGNLKDDAWALLVLQPNLFGLRPVAVIDAPESVAPLTQFEMDGSDSYHQDPDLEIVEWLWDFDNSNGYDWDNPDAAGQSAVNPGYTIPEGDTLAFYNITLRVADNSDSVLYDTEVHTIKVHYGNNPPVADAGGPYAGQPGQEIIFDGTGSFDPDSAYGDYIVEYSWDIDGDGFFGDCTDSICHYTWDYIYSGYVGLIVTDTHGATSDTSQAYVTVWTSNADVGVNENGIFFSNVRPTPGDLITIFAEVYCDAESEPVSNVKVRFYDGDPNIQVNPINGVQIISSMEAGEVDTVSVTYVVPDSLPRDIYVRVDPNQEIPEYNENNNEAVKTIHGCEADVFIDMIPDDGPPVIVPRGGSFTYTGILENCTGGCIRPDIWLIVRPVGGYPSCALKLLRNFYMLPYEIAIVPNVVQHISIYAVPGDYEYVSYAGDYPFWPEDSSMFGVTVMDNMARGGSEDWDIENWFEKSESELPTAFKLHENYPNPFNAKTIISFDLPVASQTELEIYNILGQRVEVLVNRDLEAGYHNIHWDAQRYSSGVYFYVLRSEDFTSKKRMTLIK